ncbi:MAG: DNA polymerase III subunit delta [Gemmatimonadota bacterium]
MTRALKSGELQPVYYLHGPEDVLKEEAVRKLVDRALDPSLRDFNFDQRSIGQLDPESLNSLLETLPMMAERRVVILKDMEQLKRKAKVKAVLEKYLERPSPDTVLVMLQNSGDEKPEPALLRGSTSVEFTPLTTERVLKWIAHQGKQVGVTLTPDAAQHLVDAVGQDLGIIRTELAKMSGLAGDTPLDIDDVVGLVGIRRGETLPALRDHVMAGEGAKAVAMLSGLLEQSGMSGVKIAATLGSSLIGVGLARTHYDKGIRDRALAPKLMSTLYSVKPFGLGDWRQESDRWARWAPKWPMRRIHSALKAVLAADRMLKNTRVSEDRGVLLDLVLQITEQRKGEAA